MACYFMIYMLFKLILQMLARRWMMRKAGPFIYCIILIFLSISFSFTAHSDECSDMYTKTADKYYAYKKSNILDAVSCRELMNSFRQINTIYPSCDKADDALYMVGLMGIKAKKNGGDISDLEKSITAFSNLAANYPDSTLADDASFNIGEIHMMMNETDKAEAAYKKVISHKDGDMNKKAKERLLDIEKIKPKKPNEEKAAVLENDDQNKSPVDKTIKPENTSGNKPEAQTGKSEISEDSDIDKEMLLEIISSAKSPKEPVKENDKKEKPIMGSSDKDKLSSDALSHDYAILTGIRYWSNKEYTRIVIDLDRHVPYSPPHLLKPDRDLKTTYRLFIDFKDTTVSQSMKNGVTPEAGCFTLPIGDGNLLKARAGQYLPDTARVVLDIERIDHFNAFALPGDQFRYVIDVYGTPDKNNVAINKPVIPNKPEVNKPLRPIPARTGKKTIIVIDAGHGGKDPGAVGPSGLKEKDIALALVKKAERIIERKRPDIDVVLTRRTDKYLTLVERTALANTINADLFCISTH